MFHGFCWGPCLICVSMQSQVVLASPSYLQGVTLAQFAWMKSLWILQVCVVKVKQPVLAPFFSLNGLQQFFASLGASLALGGLDFGGFGVEEDLCLLNKQILVARALKSHGRGCSEKVKRGRKPRSKPTSTCEVLVAVGDVSSASGVTSPIVCSAPFNFTRTKKACLIGKLACGVGVQQK